MSKISLAAYTIRVKKKYSQDYVNPENLEGGRQLSKVITQSIKSWSSYKTDDDVRQLVNLKKIIEEADKFYGIIETGEWGYISNLYDVEIKKITHNRIVTEAEMLPFYFLVGFPQNATHGILLLERFGAFGIRKLLSAFLNEEFQEKFPGYTLELNPIIMEEVAKEYMKDGRIIRLSFISKVFPKDLADAVDKGSRDQVATTELVLHAKKKGALPFNTQISKYFQNPKEVKKIFDIPHFEYDSIKVQIEKDGILRSISIEENTNIRSYFNIDDSLKKDITGHPEFDSIHKTGMDIYKELEKRTVI